MTKQINRRKFLKSAGAIGLGTLVLPMGASLLSAKAEEDIKLVILSTNDVHSRIEPFPANDKKFAGRAGFARRAEIIKEIRAKEKNVLLFDAGDIFQGTPYFNMFGGELELKLMSEMGYSAATMGNHDFDNGMEGFLKQLPNANFPFLCSNYDFTDTILKGKTEKYKIFELEGVKVGVFGLGVELAGLVSKKNYGLTKYLDPIEVANKYALKLKQEKCDMVVCLSHLGFDYKSKRMSDKVLASKTRNIDYIIGGHTHTFMDEPVIVLDLDSKSVTISQTGWGGINLGRMDVVFSKRNNTQKGLSYTSKKIKSQE